MLWILLIILSLMDFTSSRSIPIGEKSCRIGKMTFPISIFENYVGWECYEETYKGMNELIVNVCIERIKDVDYSVPCFKSNEKMLTFNLKNEETILSILKIFGSKELNDQMIRCYLNIVAACETSSDGWLGDHTEFKSFVSNLTEKNCALEGQSKFHIAMLSVSLIIGIPIIIIFYCASAKENLLLFHCRNLILALITRTFFSLLIETEVISEMIKSTPEEPFMNWAGCEALASFETITLNLVLAFWLILTFYVFESSKRRFDQVPDVRRGLYIVVGLAVIFAIIWIIIMAAGNYGNCWLERTSIQWVNDGLRLGFILLQTFLVSIICYHWLTHDDSEDTQARLLMKVTLFFLLLSPVFILQFSLSASHPIELEEEAHIYTEFFFDGLQCAIVSSVMLYNFCFVLKDFDFILFGFKSCLERNKSCHRVFETMKNQEMEIRHGDAPSREIKSSAKKNDDDDDDDDDEERKDITYSTILTPERFEKTIKLYNRLNIIQKNEFIHDDNNSIKSEYFDVENESVNTIYKDVINHIPEVTKKQYYKSKYLINDIESTDSDASTIIEMTSSNLEKNFQLRNDDDDDDDDDDDNSRKIQNWLINCQSINHQSNNILYRSLSGNIITGNEISGLIQIQVMFKNHKRKNSAPSLMIIENERMMKDEEETLPSIYDDLKDYSRKGNNNNNNNDNNNRKSDYNLNWLNYRNRILENRKKEKSFDGEMTSRNKMNDDDEIRKSQYFDVIDVQI